MIGVFDSGLGGLTVVKEIWKRMPEASILYVADTAHVPYGDKTKQEIETYVSQIVAWLESQRVSQIVCACNTSWAMARDSMPGALSVTEAGKAMAGGLRAGVLATTRTIESGVYEMPGVAVPGLVPLIEKGVWEGEEVEQVLEDKINRLGDVEAIVLGCTHFPLVENVIQKISGSKKILNPAVGLAKKVNLERGYSRFCVTKQMVGYDELATKILGRKIEFEGIMVG